MSPTEAAALAVIGNRDRRLVAAIVRVLHGRATADDLDSLPPRAKGEGVIAWACRCRAGTADPSAVHADCRRIQDQAEQQLAAAARLGVNALGLGDPAYPPPLAMIPDPPLMLWMKGQQATLQRLAIAIVGSRAATPHGLEMARRLSSDLAQAGVVVVSGLARGIDSAAHAAALAANGYTIGVLGCGVDRIYPAEHRDLAKNMTSAGAVVSEFPVGVPPLPHHFPLRNRIISGLSRAVVVVEAGEKSGALITAAAALEQGREVLVVPGPTTGGRNRGGHLLIRDGARLVESAEDVLAELGAGHTASDPLPSELDHLPEVTAFTVDDVAAQTGEPAGAVLTRLLELELAGRIHRVEGGRFVRGSK